MLCLSGFKLHSRWKPLKELVSCVAQATFSLDP